MNTALALSAVLSFLCATLVACQQAEELTFGVKPTDQHLYDLPFKCDDGGKILKQKQINDDYCDCVDGTDEPGTSACDNGKFWCENTDTWDSLFLVAVLMTVYVTAATGQTKNTAYNLRG